MSGISGDQRGDAAERLRELLEGAVAQQMEADVPVGALLSGGLVSTFIVSLMRRRREGAVHTYAACFPGPGDDAAGREAEAARRLGTNHHAIMISPRSGRLLPFIVSQMDEPITDPSFLATCLICRRAREDVKVLLTDDGADELLLEYPRNRMRAPEKAGGMSTTSSVEVRSPFLDARLAEFARGLPARTWRRRGEMILRDAMRPYVSGRLPLRRKAPFPPAVNDWLASEWRPIVEDVLFDMRTARRRWFDQEEARRLAREQFSGRGRHGERLYHLLIHELWARCVLDRRGDDSPPSQVDDCYRELPPDRPVRKVSVVAPAGLGDTLRMTPALAKLGRMDPAVSVTLYVDAERGGDEILAGMPPVDRHVQIPFSGRGIGKALRLAKSLRRDRPDVLVSTWFSAMAGPVAFLSGAKKRVGWIPRWSRAMRLGSMFWSRRVRHNPPPRDRDVGRYDSDLFAQMLGVGSIDNPRPVFADPVWHGRSLEAARDKIEGLERPVLGVSASARSYMPQRQYPMGQMAAALEALLDAGAGSVVFFGDVESRREIRPLAELCGPRGVDFTGRLRILETASVMNDCDALLVVNGGLLHAALATDRPIVALYGPTEIYTTDPRGECGKYTVLSAFDRCSCAARSHRGLRARQACRGESRCLASIPPERIVAEVSRFLVRSERCCALTQPS